MREGCDGIPANTSMTWPFWYACDMLLKLCREGKVIPWDLVKRAMEATHPYQVFMVRSMLAVPFFEKALYELPEDRVKPDEVLALADQTEKDVEGGLAGRSALPAMLPCLCLQLLACHLFCDVLPL